MIKNIRILIIFLSLLTLSQTAVSQLIKMADRVIVAGYVFEENSENPLPYVNVYVKRTRTGTITDTSGYFILKARINDTLTFSSLGYDKKYVLINDSARESMKPLIVFLDTKIYSLNSVDIIALKRYKQLEFEITNMRLPEDDYTYAARNFPFRPVDVDYYTRGNASSFGLILSPITMLYDMFSKEGKERRKLAEIQKKDNIYKAINDKVDKNIIMQITTLKSEQEVNKFLEWCNFSNSFISNISEYDLILVIKYKFKMYLQRKKNMP